LRERLDDLPVVADHVLRQIAAELGRDVRAFAPAALELMQSYSWPGNVRELMTVIRRGVVLSDTPVIQPADLQLQTPQRVALAATDLAAHPAPGTVAERDMLLKTLRENRFNISRTAHALGRSRVTLYRMLARNGLAQHHEFVVRDAASPAP
jgi:DNA-binding NtrC family response regulator